MTSLTKACVQALDGQYKTKPIEVLFNPAEYSIEKGNQYQATSLPGLSAPIVQFVNGNADSLSMDLFFDTYTDGTRQNVSELTGRLVALMDIDPELHAPPPVKFVWGKFQFTAILERIAQKFTMFLEDGTPVRATLNVSFKEYVTVTEQLKKTPRNSSDVTKRRIVEEGDGLWTLAHREYQDVTLWREIADANNLENPRLLQPGTELVVPPIG